MDTKTTQTDVAKARAELKAKLEAVLRGFKSTNGVELTFCDKQEVLVEIYASAQPNFR